MRKFIAKYFGYPLHDWVKGTQIKKTYKSLLESQYWDEEKMKAYQMAKLIKLINHAYENVPYYSRLFKEIGLHPRDIKTFEDYEKIPILNKEIARRENGNLINQKINLRKVTVGKTGGTTGPPLKLYKDQKARSFVWGAYHRWYNWIGVDIGEPIARITGGATTIFSENNNHAYKQNIIDWLQNSISINCFDINMDNFDKIMNRIINHKPKLLRSYVTSMNQFIELMKKQGFTSVNTDAISTTAETLLPHLREKFSNHFGCEVFDQYGCGECESIAFECKEHNGLHITSEHVYLEILKNGNNDPANEIGKVVVTDLDNYAMPFIRYENGDLSGFSKSNCNCGIKLPLLNSIEGRSTDVLLLEDGSHLLGGFFTDIFSNFDSTFIEKIKRFQAYQEKVGEIDFRIESDHDIEPKYIEQVYNLLSKIFNKVTVNVVSEISLDPSGKFRYIYSNIENSNIS